MLVNFSGRETFSFWSEAHTHFELLWVNKVTMSLSRFQTTWLKLVGSINVFFNLQATGGAWLGDIFNAGDDDASFFGWLVYGGFDLASWQVYLDVATFGDVIAAAFFSQLWGDMVQPWQALALLRWLVLLSSSLELVKGTSSEAQRAASICPNQSAEGQKHSPGEDMCEKSVSVRLRA